MAATTVDKLGAMMVEKMVGLMAAKWVGMLDMLLAEKKADGLVAK